MKDNYNVERLLFLSVTDRNGSTTVSEIEPAISIPVGHASEGRSVTECSKTSLPAGILPESAGNPQAF